MATVKGRDDVRRYFAQAPEKIGTMLRGAARAAAKVVAEEAKLRSISDEVSNAIKVSTAVEDGRVIAKVEVKGRGAYIAPWLEYGTDPHFISVDDRQREGLSVRKVNERTKAGSLVIGGKFVGDTVFHPGARPHPFLRPAMDVKETEAIAAAQNFINARVARLQTVTDAGDDA